MPKPSSLEGFNFFNSINSINALDLFDSIKSKEELRPLKFGIMSTMTLSGIHTTYTLYDYSTHTHEELAEACRKRCLGGAGYKHDLLRRLILDDLDVMWKNLLRKEWNPKFEPFLGEAAQINEARFKGAFQFYSAKIEYFVARMEDKQGRRRG